MGDKDTFGTGMDKDQAAITKKVHDDILHDGKSTARVVRDGKRYGVKCPKHKEK